MVQSRQILRLILDQKVIGGILLIIGTCLGGAMLALPISNASTGFVVSTGYLIGVWLAMTLCSYLILEVNLLFKPGTNLLTMSGETLGSVGKFVTIIVYFVLLYNLLSAYILGGSGIILTAFKLGGIDISENIAAVLFVGVFGYIVFSNIHRLDIVNRLFIIMYQSDQNIYPGTLQVDLSVA